MGVDYDEGQSIQQNNSQAIYWYQKAAAQNYAPALFNLGNIYYAEQGIQQNYAQAITWYRKAAALNSASALCALGVMIKGEGQNKASSKLFIGIKKLQCLDLMLLN